MFIADKLNAKVRGLTLESLLVANASSELNGPKLEQEMSLAGNTLDGALHTYNNLTYDACSLESFLTTIESMKASGSTITKGVVAMAYTGLDSILGKYDIGREEYASITTESSVTDEQLTISLEADIKGAGVSFLKAIAAAILAIIKAAGAFILKAGSFFKSIGTQLKLYAHRLTTIKSDIAISKPTAEFKEALSYLGNFRGSGVKKDPYDIIPAISKRLHSGIRDLQEFIAYGRNLEIVTESILSAILDSDNAITYTESVAVSRNDEGIFEQFGTKRLIVFSINSKELPPILMKSPSTAEDPDPKSVRFVTDLDNATYRVRREDLKALVNSSAEYSKTVDKLTNDSSSINAKIERIAKSMSIKIGDDMGVSRDPYNQLRRSISVYIEVYQQVARLSASIFKSINVVIAECIRANGHEHEEKSSDSAESAKVDLPGIKVILLKDILDNKLSVEAIRDKAVKTAKEYPQLFKDYVAQGAFEEPINPDKSQWSNKYFHEQNLSLETNFSMKRFLHMLDIREYLKDKGDPDFQPIK